MSSRIVDGFSDGESLAGDGDVEDSAAMESYHCFACEEEDTLHNLPECRSNRLFHKRCWNGVRAYVRTLPKGSGVTLQYKHKFLHNPVQWRQDVRGFLGDDLASRNQARLDVRRKFHEETITARVKADEGIQDTLLLTQAQFEAHVSIWEKLSEQEAQAKFHQILGEQRGVHSKGDVVRIAYEGIEKLRRRESTEVKQSVRVSTEVDESVAETKRRRIVGKTRDVVVASSASSRGACASPRTEVDDCSSVVRSSPGSPPSRPSRQVTDSKPVKKVLPQKRSCEELRQMAPSQLSPKEFMERQELLVEACDDAFGMLCGKKGALTDIERFVESMDETSNKSDLNKKTPAVVASLKSAKQAIEEHKNKIEAISAEGIIKLENDIHAAVTHLESIMKIAKDHTDALQFKQESKKKLERQQYLHDRHRTAKYQGYMTTLNFPKGLAKILSLRIFKFGFYGDTSECQSCGVPDFKADAGAMDFGKVQLWMQPADAPVVRAVVQATAKAEEASKVKHSTEKAEIAMLKNKQWTGCTQMYDVGFMESLDYSEINTAITLLHDGKGSCGPWVCTSKKWAYRFGPSAMPLTGFSYFMQAYEGDWLITVVQVEHLLSQGIVLHDFDNFAKSDAGASYFGEYAPSVRLNTGSVMYIPMGWVALPLLVNDKRSESGCGHLLCYAVLSKVLLESMSVAVRNGIAKVNNDYLVPKADSLSKHLLKLLSTVITAAATE